MAVRGAPPLALAVGAATLCLCSALAFVAATVPRPDETSASPRLRAIAAPGAGSFAGAVPAAALLAVAALAAGTRTASASVACRATAVKKKGVRVVEGKEIPWNIFSPKAPYQGKVIENHKHPQTITENTGDPNWETVHVTFDHGGNVPYIEGQSIGVIAPGPDKKGETPAKIRLYSIASSAVGDDETSKTV
eukprot:CAMPEP_0179048218 /NCGR_PEP_ID=MMETSP0796-20121207/19598_1 /TAXON_ID=73915 /ORGANISM="Pyrodinium bahamense, Strain pbaha01" /LENGTH=191 /DNA_ID=CAMNT_0020744685 /DNA_START=33 /DNA_END=605 /DNA_ORIENTATION=-